MKKILTFIFTVFLLMYFAPASFAEELKDEVQQTEEASSSSAPSESNAAAEPAVEPVAEPVAEPTTDGGGEQGSPTNSNEPSGWLAVNPDGTPAGTIFVCTQEVCGQTGPGSWFQLAVDQGLFPEGSRPILQTLQDPVEAANSPNGVGNVAGYSDANYDFENNRWIINKPWGVYEIPLAYPGVDKGGNVVDLLCIDNCITPPCEHDPNFIEREDCFYSENLSTSESEQQEAISTSVLQETNSSSEEVVNITEKNNALSIKTFKVFNKIKIKFYKKTSQVKIVATKSGSDNNIQKKIWKITKKNSKYYTFNIPKKYIGWKFSIKQSKNIKSVTPIFIDN